MNKYWIASTSRYINKIKTAMYPKKLNMKLNVFINAGLSKSLGLIMPKNAAKELVSIFKQNAESNAKKTSFSVRNKAQDGISGSPGMQVLKRRPIKTKKIMLLHILDFNMFL